MLRCWKHISSHLQASHPDVTEEAKSTLCFQGCDLRSIKLWLHNTGLNNEAQIRIPGSGRLRVVFENPPNLSDTAVGECQSCSGCSAPSGSCKASQMTLKMTRLIF